MMLKTTVALAAALLLATSAGVAAPKAKPVPAPAPVAAPVAPVQPAAIHAGFAGMDTFAQVGQMGPGVNVLSEDPGWTDASKARFKPELFAKIKTAGFGTVRIVLNAMGHMDDYFVLEIGYLNRLDTMVNAALDAGLTVILDEHDFNYCAVDTWGCRQKLNAFWAQVAPRYKDAPARLIFEIMNEPHQDFTPEMWNDQIKQTLPIIRASNPVRNVIIGPGQWNGLGFLDKLVLPVTDRHIIVTYHYYSPMEFTHQGSPWVPQYKLNGQTWGSDADFALLNKDFDVVKTWSDKWNRPILLGEFGAYETAPMESRIKYTSAVARAAEKRGFAWAYWQFDKDFIVYDIANDKWVEPILNALIPPKQ
jgi:endoglucanase